MLILVLYIFAVSGCILFGKNDPGGFGSIGSSFVTLWIISPRAFISMYINMYGCEQYDGNLYDGVESNTAAGHTVTNYGRFSSFTCREPEASMIAPFYFSIYVVITALIILCESGRGV